MASAVQPPTITYERFCMKCGDTECKITVCARCRIFSGCLDHHKSPHVCSQAKKKGGTAVNVPHALAQLADRPPQQKLAIVDFDGQQMVGLRWCTQLDGRSKIDRRMRSVAQRCCTKADTVCFLFQQRTNRSTASTEVVVAKAVSIPEAECYVVVPPTEPFFIVRHFDVR